MAEQFEFIEGFDYYPADTNAQGIGVNSTWIGAGDGIVQLQAGRFSPGKSFQRTGNGGSGSAKRPFTPASQIVMGMAFQFQNPFGNMVEGPGTMFMFFTDSLGAAQFQFRVDQVGGMHVTYGNALSTALVCARKFLLNTWHYVEFAVDMVAHTIQIWIDGEDQGLVTNAGIDQAGTHELGVCGLSYQFAGTASPWVDDMYCKTGTLEILGESRIQLLEPVEDDVVQWTPLAGDNVDNVSEASADGDTSYNFSNVVGAKDMYSFSQIAVNPSKIHGLGLVCASRKEDSGTRTIHTRIESAGVAQVGSDNNQTTNYIWTRDIALLDPATGAPWTKGAINSVKAGYQLVL